MHKSNSLKNWKQRALHSPWYLHESSNKNTTFDPKESQQEDFTPLTATETEEKPDLWGDWSCEEGAAEGTAPRDRQAALYRPRARAQEQDARSHGDRHCSSSCLTRIREAAARQPRKTVPLKLYTSLLRLIGCALKGSRGGEGGCPCLPGTIIQPYKYHPYLSLSAPSPKSSPFPFPFS